MNLAPNGKPSNLTPEQYRLVRTPEFKAWFGDWENYPETASKILDDNGEPLVCYHGTNYDFNEFSYDAVGSSHDRGFYGRGFYFTFNPDSKWMRYAKGEAGYYGSKIKDFFIQSYNPFDISELSKYKGVGIGYVGTESIVFLSNIAKMFPQLSDKIIVEQKKWNRNTQEYDFIDLPISVLPNLIEEYSKKVKTFISDDNRGNKKVSGYVKSEIVEYDKGKTYESMDILGYYDILLTKEEIEILLICDAIEKYDGIEARYNPEGYMTRFTEITDAIKENHDSILQSKYGDELVVFEPNQIKLADGTNTTFDSNNPDIRYAEGGYLSESERIKTITLNESDYNNLSNSDTVDKFNSILSKLGITIKVIEKLGKGKLGYAFLTDNGNVVKLTDNKQEALASFIFLNHKNNLKTQAKIFNVLQFVYNQSYFYLIEREYIKDVVSDLYEKEKYKEFIDYVFGYAQENTPYRNKKTDNDLQVLSYKYYDSMLSYAKESDNVFYSYLIENKDEFINKTFQVFVFYRDVVSDILLTGVRYNDVHYGNLGFHNNKLICFDCISTDSKNINSPDIRYNGGSVRTFTYDGNKNVVYSTRDYKIAVDNVNNARYITLWFVNSLYDLDVKVGSLALYKTEDDFLKVQEIGIQKSHRGKGMATKMYLMALKYSADNIKGIKSYLPDRVNKRQIPKIYQALNVKTDGGDWAYIYKADNLEKFKKGGSVKNLSKTPAPKKDRIYGSSKNKPKSSESKSKASSIILSPTVIKSINTILKEHNEDFPKKKVPLSTAKAVVRRGMGAFSSSYRPTISGGKPNSRVAWGLARLKAFVYKIQKGHSKSGKYKQDNDLIEELGYKYKEYKNGGEMELDNLYKEHHEVWAKSEEIIKNVCEENCSKYSTEIHNLYETDLKAHFVEEEQVFFPSVINENNKDLIKELIREHHLIKFLVQKIRLSKRTKDIKDFCNLMIEHIRKEELIMKTISNDPYKDMAFKNGGKIPNFDIESREGEEDRTTISLKGIGEVVLVETFPEYEFTEDIDEDTLNDLGVSEGDMIGKIEHIEIKDEYKGKGYAKLLMKKAIELAKEKGLMPLYLNASPMGSKRYGLSLEDLTGFYESFGFKVFLNQGNNNLMILKEEDYKFNEGGTMKEEYKYFLVLKLGKPVFKVKFSEYRKETERDMSDMLDKLHDMDYSLKSITEQEYKDFDYSKVDKKDILEFTKNWTYLKNGGVVEKSNKIEFRRNRLPRKDIYEFAKMVKDKYPKVWDKGGNIFGNQAFVNLERVLNRGHWLPNEEWMQTKWQSYIARHHKDFRIEGVVAMLKWIGTVDKGWAYMKKLINEEIEKKYPEVDENYKNGGQLGGKCPVGTEVQSLLFSKDEFSKEDAKDWAKSHGYKYDYVDEKENTFRIRQENPSKFVKDIFRTIEFKKGLKAIVACPKN